MASRGHRVLAFAQALLPESQYPRDHPFSKTDYPGDGYCFSGCGKTANGYTVAISQLTFNSEPGLGAGDVCGRCFAITANADPYSPSYTGPFNTIVVKATDMCPSSGNGEWCGQSESNPVNEHGAQVQYVALVMHGMYIR